KLRLRREMASRGGAEGSNPRILGIGTATPAQRFTQEEAYRLAGYDSQRILEIFLNSDIDYRHFYVDPDHVNRHETPDELNQRYLRGALEIGSCAIQECPASPGLAPRDVDLWVITTSTQSEYHVLSWRRIGPLGFRSAVERAP